MGEPLGSKPECRDALKAMYMFLDRELPAAERVHVQSHLDDCIPCLEAFEFETELKQVIAYRCRDEVPTHLVESVRARLLLEIQSNPPEGGIPAF